MNGINTNGMYNNNFIFVKKDLNIATNIKNLADKKDETETFYKENHT